MTTTTEYGNWDMVTGNSEDTVEDSVAVALGEFASHYNMAQLVATYREAINQVLPEGVTLNGNLFYGPHPRQDDLMKRIIPAVHSVNFMELAAQHETCGGTGDES